MLEEWGASESEPHTASRLAVLRNSLRTKAYATHTRPPRHRPSDSVLLVEDAPPGPIQRVKQSVIPRFLLLFRDAACTDAMRADPPFFVKDAIEAVQHTAFCTHGVGEPTPFTPLLNTDGPAPTGAPLLAIG